VLLSSSFGDVAQLVEHLLCKQGVVGSSPIVSTILLRGRPPHKKISEAHRGAPGAAESSLTSWVGRTRSLRISSENQIKLERVYVRMPRHQEPTKDVA
jgi:hypothetical protein